MKKNPNKWIRVMVVTGAIALCAFIWFLYNPGARYPIYFTIMGIAFIICFIAGYKSLKQYDIKEK